MKSQTSAVTPAEPGDYPVDLDKAHNYFSNALSISPRTNIQKELGWIAVEKGHLPAAISLLTDHLDRNAADCEAYNLLLKCFFLSRRYEAGEELARTLIKAKLNDDCFRCNLIIFQLLNGSYNKDMYKENKTTKENNPFIRHNLSVINENPRSWSTSIKPFVESKIIFQEYRFSLPNKNQKTNKIKIDMHDGNSRVTSSALISIGFLHTNEIILKNSSVSRRHAVIVNLQNEVWIYDLGSTNGTSVDGILVSGRMFLDGIHRIKCGDVFLEVTSREGILC